LDLSIKRFETLKNNLQKKYTQPSLFEGVCESESEYIINGGL